jgi:hypothetical protein
MIEGLLIQERLDAVRAALREVRRREAYRVLMVGLIVHWALHRPIVVPHDETLWARLAVFTALVLATGWSAYSWQNGVDEIRRWGLALCVGYLVAVLPQSRRDVVAVLTVLCLAPIGAACYAFVQSLRGIGPAAFAIAETGFTRANGTFGQPNSFAGYINGAWPLLLVGAVWGHRTRAQWRWLVTAGLVVCGLVLLLSFSRGGWFGAVAGVLAMLSGWAWLERAGRHAANARADAAEAQAEAQARAVVALEAQAAEAAAQAARIEPIRRVIHAAPKTTACADSPAIRAVLDVLRQGAGGDRAR